MVAIALAFAPGPIAQTRQDNDKAAADAVRTRTLPLITSRALTFTTSEATWLSLDLSQDGRTLVFEILGDLYTLPVTGGEATRITSGQAYDMQPAFSPDGKRIAFVSDRNGSENLWIANSDGTKPRAVTSTERENYMSPIWTPDGEYVIAAKGAQLWMYHQDGGSGVQMTGAAAAPAGGGAAPARSGPARSGLRERSAVPVGEHSRKRAGRFRRANGRGTGSVVRQLRSASRDPQQRARDRSVSGRAARSRDGPPARPHARARRRVSARAES